MRYLVSLGVLGLLASGSAAAQTAPAPKAALPVFSFMGDDTETPTARTTLNGAKCVRKGDLLECAAFLDASIAGVKMGYLTLDFHKGLLFRVMGSFSNMGHGKILEAFTAKYGSPAMSVKKWQSKGGATFDNFVATWTFRGGVLRLDRIGDNVDESFFIFTSDVNSPPRAKPKIDF